MISHRPGSLARFWCLMSLFVVALTQLTVVSVGSAAAAEPTIAVSGLSPEVYTGDQDVVIDLQTGDLTGTGGKLLVETFLQPTPFTSVESFESFLDGAGFPGWRLTSDEIAASSIGTDGSLTITLPSEQMPWIDPNTTGARGLTVRITPDGAGGPDALETRSALIYQPQEHEVQTSINLTVLSPVIPGFFHDSEGTDSDSEIQASQANAVESLAKIDGVSLSVLPDFFSGLEGDSSARAILPRFKKHQDAILSQDVELISRPEHDADLSLLSATEQDRLLQLAQESMVTDKELTDPAWKAASAALVDSIVFASEVGFTRHTLLSLADMTFIAPTAWPHHTGNQDSGRFTDSNGVTPTAHLEIDPATGLLASASAAGDSVDDSDVVSDSILQSEAPSVTVIDQWSFISNLLATPEGSASEELRIRQTLRTATLLVGLEDPSDRRTLMTTMDVSRETGGDALVSRAKALLDNTWVDPVSISEVISSPESVVVRATVPDWTIDNDPLLQAAGTQFSQMMDRYMTAESVASSTPEGIAILTPFTPQVLAPAGTGLVVTDRQRLVNEAYDSLSKIIDVIEVIPISQLNIVNTNTDFHVSVRNTGNVPISIIVSLHPSDQRLQSPDSATTTIAANGQESVKIPVNAVGSGDMDVQVQVTTIDGTLLDDSQIIPVRVRANWEDTGTLIVGTVLVLLFVFGIIRTVRKSRRRSKSALPEEGKQADEEGSTNDASTAPRAAWKPKQGEEI